MMNDKKMRFMATLGAVATLMAVLSGCAKVEATVATDLTPAVTTVVVEDTPVPLSTTATTTTTIQPVAVPLTSSAAVINMLSPVASGTTVYSNAKAKIDASNISQGYVMVQYLETTTDALKVIVTGPSGTAYYYDLNGTGTYEVFPLSDGNGTYNIQICRNATGTSYSVSYSAAISVVLANEFAPFLYPNQYVNYSVGSAAVAKASQLVSGQTTHVGKIQAVYDYVTTNLTYDYDRATTVQSGYLPDIDAVLAAGKGICFDYAAVMTAMLRSQGIPCKMVFGYAGTAYHAWISTYSATEGWVDASIYFDGTNWQMADPTFAASGSSSADIAAFIGTGANYVVKYLY